MFACIRRSPTSMPPPGIVSLIPIPLHSIHSYLTPSWQRWSARERSVHAPAGSPATLRSNRMARLPAPRPATSRPTARASTCSTTAGPRHTSARAASTIPSSRSPYRSRRCRDLAFSSVPVTVLKHASGCCWLARWRSPSRSMPHRFMQHSSARPSGHGSAPIARGCSAPTSSSIGRMRATRLSTISSRVSRRASARRCARSAPRR